MRPTRVEIDLGAVAHNVAALASLIAPSVLCVVVKADAYGHGDVPIGETAVAAGAGWLAVALVEEGIRLRESGIDAPVLLLSEPDPGSAREVVAWRLTPTAYTRRFIDSLALTGEPVAVHLKVDTGMHRVGVPPDTLPELVDRVASAPNLTLEGVWTHFAVADEDPDFTRRQIRLFDEIAVGQPATMRHMANTAGAILFPEARTDMARVGLGVYGLHPCPETRRFVELQPAMRLVSEVTHVQRLEAGERLSYGRVRPLSRPATVATVPVGYADGFSRSRRGDVLIGGRRHPLAGRVTMDQIVVDVGDADVTVGDEVVLIGRQGAEEMTADEWAAELGTVSYEIVCSIGPRVPRRYLA